MTAPNRLDPDPLTVSDADDCTDPDAPPEFGLSRHLSRDLVLVCGALLVIIVLLAYALEEHTP